MKKIIFLFFFLILIAIVVLKFFPVHFNLPAIDSENKSVFFLIVTISGLIDSINPCAVSVLFISLSSLAGLGFIRKKLLYFGISYISGIYISYFLIGVGIFKTLGVIGIPVAFLLKVFAVILIGLGINKLFKISNPESGIKLRIPAFIKPTFARLIQRGSYPTSFLLGMLVGLFEFPCTGGPYLLVLGLLKVKETFASGLLYLFYYNLLFVLPLIIILYIAYQLGDLNKIQQKSKAIQKYGKLLTPIILILLGVLILFFY